MNLHHSSMSFAEFPVPDCCALIINPTSGGYSELKIGKVMADLAAVGLSPRLFLTQRSGHATSLAAELCGEYANPLLIAGGGDGTMNEVLNGLVPGQATLAVLPLGTANVLAKELSIRSLDDAMQRIVRGTTRPLSVGLMTAEGIRRYFVLMAGIGFDAAVAEGVRGEEKKKFRQGAYLLSAMRHFRRWDRGRLQVFSDGRHLECHSAVICNAASYGGSFRLAPEATLFTPGFETVCVTDGDRIDFIRLAAQTVFGRTGSGADICRFTAPGVVTIEGRKAVQVDGDFCCYSPVKIEAVGNFARLIV